MTTQYNLTINRDGETLSMTTTDPESLKRIMALSGLDVSQAQVEPCGCEGGTEPMVVVDEASTRFANSVAGAKGETRVVGDTVDFAMKGTGTGKPEYQGTRASADNPLGKDLEEAQVPLIDEDNLLKEYADYKVEETKKPKNPYAVGMAQAMKSTGDEPPLKKSTIKKAHEIAKAIGEAHGISLDEEGDKPDFLKQLAESDDSPVGQAIARRIMMQHTDVLAKFGPQKVLDAIDDVADFVGDVEEIGSSDVSGWTKQVIDRLSRTNESVVKEALNIDGKEVDLRSIEIDGVDSRDYPDFSDAYISYACFKDGTELNDGQLEKLTYEAGDIVNELAHDQMHGAGDSWKDARNESVDLNALKVLAGVTPTAKKENAVSPEIAALKALAGI